MKDRGRPPPAILTATTHRPGEAGSISMRSFVSLGGIFMQIDAVDTAMLRDAQEHPDKYPNLSVRVSGWSARFATLSKNYQEMLIVLSEQRVS